MSFFSKYSLILENIVSYLKYLKSIEEIIELYLFEFIDNINVLHKINLSYSYYLCF